MSKSEESSSRQKQEDAPPAFDVIPKKVIATIDRKNYPIIAMNEEESDLWMSFRLKTHWRQLTLFRQINAKVLGAMYASPDQRMTIDEDINLLTREWITVNNVLVARALRFKIENLTKENIELIQGLSEGQKLSIIILQDRVNNLDIIKVLSDASKNLSEIEKSSYEPVATNSKVLSKRFSKKLEKKKKKR
jgi:hypothetical protein